MSPSRLSFNPPPPPAPFLLCSLNQPTINNIEHTHKHSVWKPPDRRGGHREEPRSGGLVEDSGSVFPRKTTATAGRRQEPQNKTHEGDDKCWGERRGTWREGRGRRDSRRRQEGKRRRGDSGGEPYPRDGRLRRIPIPIRRSRVAQEGRHNSGRSQGRVQHGQSALQRACLQVMLGIATEKARL